MEKNLDVCIERLGRGELLDAECVADIAARFREYHLSEPNVVALAAPVTVVSNLHGQLGDLLEVFAVAGPVPGTNYLVLGDMVDYGTQSVETVLLLFCLKLRYPARMTLLRGEHESRSLTRIYGLYLECLRKYGTLAPWHALTSAFDALPLAAIIGNAVFCVHGGIPHGVASVDSIRVFGRFMDVPQEGPFCELLWGDPQLYNRGRAVERGFGVPYTEAMVRNFLHRNQLQRIVRGHQILDQGYIRHYDGALVSIWTAPNFLGTCGNAGCALEITNVYFEPPAAPPASNSDHRPPQLVASKKPEPVSKKQTNQPPPISDEGFFYNTFLAAPRSFQFPVEPNPLLEIPRGIPEFFQ